MYEYLTQRFWMKFVCLVFRQYIIWHLSYLKNWFLCLSGSLKTRWNLVVIQLIICSFRALSRALSSNVEIASQEEKYFQITDQSQPLKILFYEILILILRNWFQEKFQSLFSNFSCCFVFRKTLKFGLWVRNG